MIDYLGHTVFADSIMIEFMDEENFYQRKDIPIYGDFEDWVKGEGYLNDGHFDMMNEWVDDRLTIEEYVHYGLKQKHLIEYIDSIKHKQQNHG